jgi:hypothetical protein
MSEKPPHYLDDARECSAMIQEAQLPLAEQCAIAMVAPVMEVVRKVCIDDQRDLRTIGNRKLIELVIAEFKARKS